MAGGVRALPALCQAAWSWHWGDHDPPQIDASGDGVVCVHRQVCLHVCKGTWHLAHACTQAGRPARPWGQAWPGPGAHPHHGALVAEELTCSARLTVQPSVEPLFTRPLEDLAVVEGRAARFDCKISGNPPPAVTWTHFGERPPSWCRGLVLGRWLRRGTDALCPQGCRCRRARMCGCCGTGGCTRCSLHTWVPRTRGATPPALTMPTARLRAPPSSTWRSHVLLPPPTRECWGHGQEGLGGHSRPQLQAWCPEVSMEGAGTMLRGFVGLMQHSWVLARLRRGVTASAVP